MSKPVKRDTENARRLIFCEKPLAGAEVASVSINAAGEKFCGDCTEHFVDQYGCAHMILSDGMGSGEPARKESALTCRLLRQFLEALHKLGLEEIEAENAPFDPNVHNAVMREDADGVEPDTVTAVFQKGYKLGDSVLRFAMVQVVEE